MSHHILEREPATSRPGSMRNATRTRFGGRLWGGRRCGLRLMLFVYFTGVAAASARSDDTSPPAATSAASTESSLASRQKILDLFALLHSQDESEADRAREQLNAMGLAPQEVELGAKLMHPDVGVRVGLARELASSSSPNELDLLLELTRDLDATVRRSALEAAQSVTLGPTLAKRIAEMAESDSDAVVRGYAKLINAEVQARGGSATAANNQPAEATESPAPQPPTTAGPAASAPPELPPVAPDETRSVDFNPREPLDSPQSLPRGLKPTLPSHPEAAAEGDDEHGREPLPFPDFENPSSFRAPSESRTLPDRTPRTLLVPVVPFWMQRPEDASSSAGLAADANVGSYFEPEPGTELVQPAAAALLQEDGLRPDVLGRPLEPPFGADEPPLTEVVEPIFTLPVDSTLGFAGPSSVIGRNEQFDSHFVPMEDRWRMGFPAWDRYGRNHPYLDDYPSVPGHWWDPYNQNVLKGDYPIIGQHTFLNVTVQNRNINNFQQVPTGTTPFESTFNPFQENFFGNPRQYQNLNFTSVRFDLFHGNALVFKPLDWQIRLTPTFNRNYLRVNELAIVNPDVRKGTRRTRHDFSLEEWFVEAKLADIGPDYDFLSARAGSQFFNSDFRGFIFSDTNRAVRLFGTRFGNRDQFNLLWFDQTEKETNSLLNTWDDRHQNTLIANYYRQDFIFPGYTAQASYHYNNDNPSFKFDENNFLVRPDPVGVFLPHRVEAHYLGFAGDGHIGRINISNAFYWALGDDSRNPLAGEKQDIDAKMFALELSLDRDWVRFRTSFFHSSGDDDIFDDKARGFDSIFDNPNFAGGEFSYWQRQAVRLFGVNLVQNNSLVPDLRSSKIQGQSNFVNPGLDLVNFGMDFEITPKMKLITNANYLWFNTTHVLEIFTFQNHIDPEIGIDLSAGIEYRPLLNDNVIIIAGFAALIPGKGFDDLYGTFANPAEILADRPKVEAENLYSNFLEVIVQY
ncbi:MAG: hypothetical protein KY476_04775 [Planctomycetes bacterium]|nr:hypothetical protein [Planctomycetota bacterium]